jgi:hypothetical protein
MSQLLLSELAQLSSETKRKQPDVRAAADAALAALRADEQALLTATRSAKAGTPAGDVVLLRPILLVCQGKGQPKSVGIALGLLQRMLGMRIVPEVSARSVRCLWLQQSSGLRTGWHHRPHAFASDLLRLAFVWEGGC